MKSKKPKLHLRECPTCKKEIKHRNKYVRNLSVKKKRNCGSCRSKIQITIPSTRRKRISSLKKVKHTWHNKIAKNRKKNGTYLVTEEVREKHRVNKIERMIKTGVLIWPNFNRNACKFFERLESDLNWSGIFATKGNEKRIGRFWVDYYEPRKNVVIEYDEQHHFDNIGNLKPKDVYRQNWIVNKIGCKFYRINKNTNYEQFKNFISSNMP